MTGPRNDKLLQVVGELLGDLGMKDAFAMKALPGGANNRVYQILCGRERFFLKAYFQHPRDPRDRLKAESAFADFAWRTGVRALPRLIAARPENGVCLFQFLEGRKLRPGEVSLRHIQAALDFFKTLNQPDCQVHAAALAPASEACFSLAQHLETVRRRIKRLQRTEPVSPLHQQALEFASGPLSQAWQELKESVSQQTQALQLGLERELSPTERCVSPSDFGYHNALLDLEGNLKFIDFEYAGWDDPAKLVGDFFSQPAVPAPLEYFGCFAREVAEHGPAPAKTLRRMALLLPVYRIKWCCIVLNDFLLVDSQRRNFALGSRMSHGHLEGQLALAGQLLDSLRRVAQQSASLLDEKTE